jgi:hypothetical protein
LRIVATLDDRVYHLIRSLIARTFNNTCRSSLSYNDTINVYYGLKALNQKVQKKSIAFIFPYSVTFMMLLLTVYLN